MANFWVVALGLLLVSSYPANAETPPRYTLTVLPLTFYSLSGRGSGLNNRGQVVGVTGAYDPQRQVDAPPSLRLALWQRGRRLRLLVSAQEQAWAGRSSTAAAINDRGEVAGNFQVINSGGWTYTGSNSFRWAHGRLAIIPGLPGDDYWAVTGLNNLGDAVGTSNKNIRGDLIAEMPPGADPDAPHAFVSSHGRTASLGLGIANGINDRGQIVGASGGRAILWQNGVQKTLGEGEASAINAHGLIAGTCVLAARQRDKTRACLWQDGRRVILSRLPSHASAVNSRGQVVGRADVAGPGGAQDSHAALWRRGREYDLNRYVRLPQGWTLTEATGINDAGWIIGEGYVDSGPRAHSPARGFTFLLTPR